MIVRENYITDKSVTYTEPFFALTQRKRIRDNIKRVKDVPGLYNQLDRSGNSIFRILSWDSIITEIQNLFSNKTKQERCLLILSKIYTRINLQRWNKEESNEYSCISFKDMELFGGRDWKTLIQSLVTAKLIMNITLEQTEYCTGHKMGYRLSDRVLKLGQPHYIPLTIVKVAKSLSIYRTLHAQNLTKHGILCIAQRMSEYTFNIDHATYTTIMVQKFLTYKQNHIHQYKHLKDSCSNTALTEHASGGLIMG